MDNLAQILTKRRIEIDCRNGSSRPTTMSTFNKISIFIFWTKVADIKYFFKGENISFLHVIQIIFMYHIFPSNLYKFLITNENKNEKNFCFVLSSFCLTLRTHYHKILVRKPVLTAQVILVVFHPYLVFEYI